MSESDDDKTQLELIDKSIGECVDNVNKAYFRLKIGIYNLFFIGILTLLSFFLDLGIISLILLAVSIIVLVFVAIGLLILKDNKIKLKINVLIVKSIDDLKGSNIDIVEKHLNRLEPEEYMPSWISVIHDSTIF